MINHRVNENPAFKIDPTSFLNKSFSTGTTNSRVIKQAPDAKVNEMVKAMFGDAPVPELVTLSKKETTLSLADLNEVVNNLFGDSVLGKTFSALLAGLKNANELIKNTVKKMLSYIDPIVDGLCFLLGLFVNLLTITIPVITLLLGLLALLRLFYEKCASNVFNQILEAIDDPVLERIFSISALNDSLASQNDGLTGDVLHSDRNGDIIKYYPNATTLVTGQYGGERNRSPEAERYKAKTVTKHEIFVDEAIPARKTYKRYVYKSDPPSPEFLRILSGVFTIDPDTVNHTTSSAHVKTQGYSPIFKAQLHKALPATPHDRALSPQGLLFIHSLLYSNDADSVVKPTL